MRKPGSPKELEQLRLIAARLFDLKRPTVEIATAVGRDAQTIRAWKRLWLVGGIEALKAKPHPGRMPKLSADKWQQVLGMLQKSPKEHGIDAYLWTTTLMARLIKEQFSVDFHHDYIGEMLHTLGWSCQKPTKLARERDEQAIAGWKAQTWPALLKKVASERH
jgi:transposase